MNKISAVKITAGQYRLGNLVVVRHAPDRRGTITTWCRADRQGGGVLGYSLKEVVRLVNTPRAYAFDLARGTKTHGSKSL